MKNYLEKIKDEIQWEIYGIILISIGILGLFAIYTNAVGIIGVFLKNNLCGFLGCMAVIAPLLVIFWGIYGIYCKKAPVINWRLSGIFIIFTVISMVLHIKIHEQLAKDGLKFLDRLRKSANLGVQGVGGGVFSETILTGLFNIVGPIGTYILLSTFSIIGIILTTGFSISSFIRKQEEARKSNVVSIVTNMEKSMSKDERESMDFNEKEDKNTNVDKDANHRLEDENIEDVNILDLDSTDLLINKQEDKGNYILPSIDLLKKNTEVQKGFSEKELLADVKILEKTLLSFNVEAKVVQVSCGPTITRFEIQPSPGTKVSKIVNLSDDIALSLAASDIRIEAPIPGKAAVGIEVPNKKKFKVFLRDVLETKDFIKSPSKLSVALGKDIGGKAIITDLADMPHLLIAGATGSGKSVCINTIISSILYKACPSEVKMMLIDPKVVELAIYNDIPHLLIPVVTDAKKAASALNWMVVEMERRYKLFAEKAVRDIDRYNELEKDEPLPKILVIIDELADLMMVSPSDVEDSICRLAQMARAAGIHLIVATQRPSVDIITGLIKANIPSRISFAVSSQVDSRTILDISGAEKLLGKGDMLFFPAGASKPKRVQGAYISEAEVEKLVDFVKQQRRPSYEKKLSDFEEVISSTKADETDELFDEALSVIFDYNQASISLLQRKLHIGYTRAARLIDQLEEYGYVGGYEGTKPREILITREQYENLSSE